MISDIFGNIYKKNKSTAPYFAILFISVLFFIFSSMFIVDDFSRSVPFFLVSIFGMIFSFAKIIALYRKNTWLPELVEEFFELKKIENPDFLTLKKQEILCQKIAAFTPTKHHNSDLKEYYHVNEIRIHDKVFMIDAEKIRIERQKQEFLEKYWNHPKVILQIQLTEIFEKIIQEKDVFKKDENLKKMFIISSSAIKKKSIFQAIIGVFLFFFIPFVWSILQSDEVIIFDWSTIYSLLSDFFVFMWTFGTFFILLITFLLWWLKCLKGFDTKVHLREYFSLLINTMISYLSQIKDSAIHHTDALFFADLMNFLWENILERKKRIEKYEKFFYNNYRYFCIQFSVPEEIEKYFNKEKIQLRDDAILVQKIVQKWSEIESFRLQKNSQNASHPAVLASNKRRELMLRNLQNFSKNL